MQETLGSASIMGEWGWEKKNQVYGTCPWSQNKGAGSKRSEVHPWLHTKFEGSLGYIHPEKETKQKQRKKISFFFLT